MISSTSSADRTPRTDLVSAAGHASARTNPVRPDQISTEHAEFLRSELGRQPEIRPEVVQRARELAADSTYPSAAISRHVAAQILAAPDLSEVE
jgi:hypothetical protein